MVLLTRLPLASSIDYFAVMPYLSIQTNRDLPEKKQTELLGAASKIVASELGKPESVVMVSFAPAVHMTFAGEPHGIFRVTKHRGSGLQAELSQFGLNRPGCAELRN
jgi:phenylpyruvate tautomerase PptA (4-oxalocrotonate tautomerase family)